MSGEQSSKHKRISEVIADQATKFSGEFANTLLRFLDLEQADRFTYYAEIDRRIQEFLQSELNDAGYSHVTAQSLGRGNSSADYQYLYLLVPREKDPKWAERYLPNVKQALYRRLYAITKFNFYLEKNLVFVKLAKSMLVSKTKSAKEPHNA